MQVFVRVGRGHNELYFGDDPDSDLLQEFFQGLFINYRDR